MNSEKNISFKDNGFTLIRYICAFQVFYGHAVEAFGLETNSIVTSILSMFRGVPVFFALSGFLIWHSLKGGVYRNLYFKKRFRRLFPELWLSVLLSIFTILLFVRVELLPFLVWIITQSTVFQFWTPDFLRSYGVGTPNGSLWTVSIFAQFYIAIYIFYVVFRKIQKKWMIWLLPIVGLAINFFWIVFVKDRCPEIVDKLYRATLIPYIWIFGIGIVIYEFKDILLPIIVKGVTPISVLLFLHCYFSLPDINIENYLLIRTPLIILFSFGLAYKFNKTRIRIDFSYEIYLVHMIVINVFVELGLVKNWWIFCISLICSIILAVLEWKINKMILQKQ